MDIREIKSPADDLETPGSVEPDGKSRKKLGVFLIESDNRRMAFGLGYTGGTTPVNIHGKPIADLSKTGVWIVAFFIFVNNFLGISQASSVLGGFLADAYLGRYSTIAIFATIYLAGLIGITLYASNEDFCAGSRSMRSTVSAFGCLDKAALQLNEDGISNTLDTAGVFVEYSHGKLKLLITCMPVFPGLAPESRHLSVYFHLIGGLGQCFRKVSKRLPKVFSVVGLLEFLYEEAPDAMKSIGSVYVALAGLAISEHKPSKIRLLLLVAYSSFDNKFLQFPIFSTLVQVHDRAYF
ncbi:Protein NRT1/ PTR FAMILY 6.1 [Hibiscus syriacus]|uniref:Protein NRT1/ PTR FAMILY 6.1 n=1 Tax=Hibiscus syriacus TaxID=106335 RepID=A0A6A2X0P7_HIBSY|nr:Protein NRT1/ PTR FAMILY 6.1 [Hibiscus syriacus]